MTYITQNSQLLVISNVQLLMLGHQITLARFKLDNKRNAHIILTSEIGSNPICAVEQNYYGCSKRTHGMVEISNVE